MSERGEALRRATYIGQHTSGSPMHAARRMARLPYTPMTGHLPAFLLGRHHTIPPSAALRATHLAAYAYTVLPGDHPRRAELREDFLAACARHHAIVRELAPLVAAWHAAGVDAMLFKGFHLAELVYPVAGARFHGDADVLVRPEHEADAVRVATELGWVGEMHHAFGHGVCNLYLPGGAAQVDLHRLVVHGLFSSSRRRSVTHAIHSLASAVSWRDTVVRVPHPVDALLILVLQRGWGSERWRLKPQDVLDVRMLIERAGVTLEAARARARELGCARTLELFLERCDPTTGRVALSPPSRRDAMRRDAVTLVERRAISRAHELTLIRLAHAPAMLLDAALTLPLLWRVRRAHRTHTDLRQLLASLTPPSAPLTPRSRPPRTRVARGIRWASRLLRVGDGGPCVVRSLALYVALRRLGWPAVFVSGVRREGAGVVGHAWVELDGRVLPELGEPFNREWFQVGFQYPDADSPSVSDSALHQRAAER